MTSSARARRRDRHLGLIRASAVAGAAALSATLLPTAAWAAQTADPPSASTPSVAAATGTRPSGDSPTAKADPAVLSAERSASAQAKAAGRPVVVDALTDETSQTLANADGTFTATQYASPVRVRQGSKWVAVNTVLARRADGTFTPGATDADVAFSGGGSTPLVTMTRAGGQIAISWPGTLPAPTVVGDTATYPEVLPGVDLAMTARPDGFGEVLIVKTAAAAADPGLAQLHFGIATKGLTLTTAPDGTEAAVDAKGTTVFKTDTPTMWDSSTAAPAVKSAGQAADAHAAAPAGIGSDFRQPGSAAHVAPLGVTFDGGGLTVTPSHALLSSPASSFPEFIDPAWSGNPSVVAWASINSNGGKWTSGTDADLGLDNWSGCGSWCGSVSRSYFEMNDSGFQGANVTAATFYPYFTWSSDSATEPVQIWLDPDFPSNLDWSNKPSGSASTYVTAVNTCAGHGTSGCAAGTVAFTVTSAAVTAAGGGKRDFEVDAADESNELQWKRIDPTKTSWSVTYYRAPYLNSTYTTTPKVTGPGGTFVNSTNVTMLVTGGDSDGENVRSGYEIWNWANNTNTTNVANSMFSAYSASGGAFTHSGLPDGTYAWRGVIESESGGMWTAWSPWQVFTVDTSQPPTPSVESAQFPANQFGASYTDTGNFTLTTHGVDNVAGFIFSLDGDLGSTAWSQTSPPPTWSNGAITRAKDYWAPISGGVATVSFSPLTVGPHRLYAKAVDQAGNTSATEATYLFYAGLTSPSYAYGDQLANGCAVNACNGNTVAVPAAHATLTGGGEVLVQGTCCNIRFADGNQVMLANGSGHIAVGDTVTYSFNVPSTGYWDIGANLTSGTDYGQYTLTLDQGASTQDTLVTGYDAYASTVTTSYHDYGPVKNAAGAAVQLNAGIHTLTLTVTGKNSASTGYQNGIDVLRLAPMSATCTITDLSSCQDNTAISDDSNHLAADADGYGESFSSSQLTTAGWKPGASITVNGAPMTLPNYAIGKADNILSSGQTVNVPSTYSNSGNAVEFLAFGTNGAVTGASGTITYANACNSSVSQPFTIDDVPDWTAGSAAQHVIGFANRNNPSGQDSTSPQVFAVSVPLTCPGQAIASVSLPVVTNKTLPGQPALHILAIGIRASSYTDTSDAQNWTGTFAAAQDSHLGSLGAQTVRMPVHISVAGTSLRLHLSNALGSVPVSFDDVTVAQQSSGAVPVGTPTPVLFNAGKTVTIPAGGEAVSDSLNFPTTGQETLLVSLHLSASDGDVVGHGSAQNTSWTATAGSDQAADASGTPFTATITNLDWLSGIDVTSDGATLGSLVLYGDQTVNSDSASGDGQHHLSDVLAGKLAAGNGGVVPYGVLSEGTNSWNASNNLLPALSTSTTNTSPPTALNPADRNILDNTNVRTVLISTGMSDILAGGDATTIENKLSALSEQVRHAYTDDATDYNVNINNAAGLLTVYVATIPPNATALTSAQENVREAVNAWILTKATSGSYANGNADGAIDFAAAVSNNGTDLGTTVNTADLYNGNPDDSYYSALAQQYLTNTVSPPAPTSTVAVQPMVISPTGGVRG
ncbi:hypothetical protein ABH920_002996 [Catenulispora sp. EB89]|uniref:hypothetical protein n=1 Tax=Catenulispora sp. EB89 TaxID=3156257 RepID=UPI003510F51E